MGEESCERNADVHGRLLALALVVFGDEFYASDLRHPHLCTFRMLVDEYEDVEKHEREARVSRSSHAYFSLARKRWIFSQRFVGHHRVVRSSESFVLPRRRSIFD